MANLDDGPFPIDDYDRLRTIEILRGLPDLDGDQLRLVLERERAGRCRVQIVGRVEGRLRDLRAAPAAGERQDDSLTEATAKAIEGKREADQRAAEARRVAVEKLEKAKAAVAAKAAAAKEAAVAREEAKEAARVAAVAATEVKKAAALVARHEDGRSVSSGPKMKTTTAAVGVYVRERRAGGGSSPRSEQRAYAVLSSFAAACPDPRRISRQDARRWLLTLGALSLGSRRECHAIAHDFTLWLVRTDVASTDPFDRLPCPTSVPVPRPGRSLPFVRG